ncbi:MAG: class I SAM-dependent methyltransferase [Rhodospirillales bacterium]|nr:class I SAM-dependent methyltransferase [Rhodospirillales bacterium]
MILPAVSLLSAAILAYEVLLMRLFAIVQWHHFAYMVISMALLGYGASGTFLTLAQDWLKPRFTAAFAANAAGFGVFALICFALGERVPFNALEVVWDLSQLAYLIVLYLLFTLPFFCGANCIGLAFACLGDRIGRIYRYDLVGAGLGALGIVAALSLLSPAACLRLITGLGIGAAGLACLGRSGTGGRWTAAGLFAAALVLPVAAPPAWTTLQISEYKGLNMALRVPGTEVLEEYSGPLGLLTVVRSPDIPFRHAPGLSLNNRVEPPPQLGVFTDGDGLSVITRYDGRREALAYLDYVTSALPYHLLREPAVLVLGAGGGADVLQAVYHRAARIDAVELNPDFLRLVERDHADFAGGLYARPEVRVYPDEARSFVARSRARWDLIQIPLLDSAAVAAAGVQNLSESYLYTTEAFGQYLDRLEPGGLLAITRWLKLPPRDSLKLLATALAAFEQAGLAHPERRIALIRGWNTTTLLVKNGFFGDDQIAKIGDFAEERAFDLAYLPGMRPEQANRFNVLQTPFLFEAATALLGPDRAAYIARYKFDLTPASDDRPYFFDFFKWQSLAEFLELRRQGGGALIEWGYLILFATLVQAAVLSLVLIVLPLRLRRRKAERRPEHGRILAYFFGLGLAFLFVEIAFIQRFIVFLGHPLYAVSVMLCGFLVFAGLGSGFATRLAAHLDRPRTGVGSATLRVSAIDVSVAAIAAIALTYLWALPPLLEGLMPWPTAARVVVSLALVAPLAFFMGLPFPLGLSRVSARVPELVPWAWGVNGCASVLSAVLAMILAMHFGFSAVLAIAIGLYAASALAFRRSLAPQRP